MRLALPSLIMVLYVTIRLIVPLPWRFSVRMLLAAAVLAAGAKFQWYEWLGGAFFAPALPRPALLVLEGLYAALVLLFLLTLLRDIALLAARAFRRPGPDGRRAVSIPAQSAGLALLAVILAAVGVWQAVRVPTPRTVEVRLPHLPRALDGFSLAHVSDIHIGPVQKRDWLKAVVERVNALKPDAIALTGDFIDGLPGDLRDELTPLADLRAPRGVYGVTGNHEYYYDAPGWISVFEEMGVDMLENEHRVLSVGGEPLVIAGVPDSSAIHFGMPGPDPAAAFAGAPDGARVLLSHQPRGAAAHARKASAGEGADLQLSGHTHGGLMLGLRALIAAFNDGFSGGLYDVEGMKLYVHPGTGLWSGFSCRVGVPSEITLLVLRGE